MRNSAKSRTALNFLSSNSSSNALLFYDNDKTLEKFLFHYVKKGIENGEKVSYWAGVRRTEEVEQRMSDFGIDCDYYKRNGMLHFTSYDDVFLVDGRLDLTNGCRNLFNMLKNLNGNSYRIATESNWWLLSDVFEGGMEMETAHEIIPNNISVVCSYNLADLLQYVNIYHLAKLMELHNDTLLVMDNAVMLSREFYSYLGKSIIAVLEESFDYITIVRKKHPRFISEVLLELEMRIGSDMLELERTVEDKIISALKLD